MISTWKCLTSPELVDFVMKESVRTKYLEDSDILYTIEDVVDLFHSSWTAVLPSALLGNLSIQLISFCL